MIEVLFGESEAASMKAAKNSNTSICRKVNGPATVIGKITISHEQYVECIQGKPKEVICLGFMLDIGNIKETIDSKYRKDLIYSLYCQEQLSKDPKMEAELRKLGILYVNELVRLKKYLENGESIRIWYSNSPYSICGFYCLCKWLQQFNNDVLAVKLPEYKVKGNTIASYQNWGEVEAEEFAGFLQYEKKLSKEEQRLYALLWSELKEDNSPLRTVINGKVVGVSEDFYDFLIWKRLTGKPIKQARLIGDILGCYPIGIGDWWYAARIEHFIKEGKIKVNEDSDNKYGRMICLA